ncbi:hypothetical protein RhiXN_09449 [Rhizoctonia solani]|uniref:Uncharacterized protein n=1 Tax=Rhizoctonia solani TaxID=456999 RepID=A0A8H8SWK9_9AGAM|nr:uncharacterized protein RhiXN_09449 [Rhizoctonia solani]QRW20474.1 hypothetical protein RhiXN_09449 [Rhizoctonia solani]
MSVPGINLQAILGQLMAAAQGPSALQTPNTGPTDVTAIIAALSLLSPQLASAIQNQPPLNTAVVDDNPLSDLYRRAHMTFKANNRPKGTPGRGKFKLKEWMGLSQHNYELFLRTVKDAVYAANLNRTQMMKAQDPERLTRARAKIKKALPGLAVYANCNSPYWPVDAGLLVILKSLTESHRRQMEQAAQEQAAQAQASEFTPDGANDDDTPPDPNVAPDTPPGPDVAPIGVGNGNDDNDGHSDNGLKDCYDDNNDDGNNSSNDDDKDEGKDGNVTMASAHDFDELRDMQMDAGHDPQEDEEMADNTPSSNPPAYNSALSSTNPVLDRSHAPVTANKPKSRKSSPNVSAPAAVGAPAPAKKRAQLVAPTASNPVAPTDPAAARSNRSRRDNKAGAVSSPVSIAPSSNVISTSAVAAPATTTISYASTTNTTVQAQASSTTGLPLEPGNAAHSAWLPASKRPSLPPASGPEPTEPLTRGKRATRKKPQANSKTSAPSANSVQPQPTPKPKRKTKAAMAKEAESMGLSDVEPTPPPKPARKTRTPATDQPAKKKAGSKSK